MSGNQNQAGKIHESNRRDLNRTPEFYRPADQPGVRVLALPRGGTTEALARRLLEEKGIGEIYVGASHNLCLARADQRLQTLRADGRLKAVVVTDSNPQTETFQNLPFFSIASLADRLSQIVNRIHYNRPVGDLINQMAHGAAYAPPQWPAQASYLAASPGGSA